MARVDSILALLTLKEMQAFVKQGREFVKDTSEDLSLENKPNFYVYNYTMCALFTKYWQMGFVFISRFSQGVPVYSFNILKNFGQRKYEIL